MAKKRVFVGFDFDNDKVIKDFVIGQSRLPNSPFEVIDHSLKEAAPQSDWEQKARSAIKRSDIVLIMVGKSTYKASGVLKEVAIAREEQIKIVQMIGYKDGDYTPVPMLSISEMGHFLNRTLWHDQAALTSSLRPRL